MKTRTESLVRRAKRADRNAARELVTTHYTRIFAYLRRLCGSTQNAEDLTQETFLRVWASLESFNGHSKFSTWLHRIAHNTYIDFRRSNARDRLLGPELWWLQYANELPDPLADAAERQLARRLYEAVDQLDDDKKHVVHLHYYQGLSIRETAGVLRISASTVKYRLREVFKLLRAKLPEEEKAPNQTDLLSTAEGEPI